MCGGGWGAKAGAARRRRGLQAAPHLPPTPPPHPHPTPPHTHANVPPPHTHANVPPPHTHTDPPPARAPCPALCSLGCTSSSAGSSAPAPALAAGGWWGGWVGGSALVGMGAGTRGGRRGWGRACERWRGEPEPPRTHARARKHVQGARLHVVADGLYEQVLPLAVEALAQEVAALLCAIGGVEHSHLGLVCEGRGGRGVGVGGALTSEGRSSVPGGGELWRLVPPRPLPSHPCPARPPCRPVLPAGPVGARAHPPRCAGRRTRRPGGSSGGGAGVCMCEQLAACGWVGCEGRRTRRPGGSSGGGSVCVYV